MNITIRAVNDAPTVNDVTKNGDEDTPLYFTDLDFSAGFSDIDGDILNGIKIITIPANGILSTDDTPITPGDEITAADMKTLRFDPDANWYGDTTFAWKAGYGNAWSTESANMRITIIPTPVNIESISKSGHEDQDIFFEASDLEGFEFGADSKIRLVTLPEHGVLMFDPVEIGPDHEFDGTPLSEGQEMLMMTELMTGELLFRPDPNFNGSVIFMWRISKAGEWSDDKDVKITITPANDPPKLLNINKSGEEDTEIRFTAEDFSDAFNDIDGDIMSNIRITSLPANGILEMHGTGVALNDDISVPDLGGLVFKPNDDYNGPDSFEWNGSDETAYAEEAANVSINVSSVNDAPIVSDVIKIGDEDTTLYLSG